MTKRTELAAAYFAFCGLLQLEALQYLTSFANWPPPVAQVPMAHLPEELLAPDAVPRNCADAVSRLKTNSTAVTATNVNILDI